MRFVNFPAVRFEMRALRQGGSGSHEGRALSGSTLRGAWGRALRDRVCSLPLSQACATCVLGVDCSFPALFEPLARTVAGRRVQPPPPYVIELPRRTVAGDVNFGFVLIGKGLRALPQAVEGWRQALGRYLNVPCELDSVRLAAGGDPVFSAAGGWHARPPGETPLNVPPGPDALRVRFVSPLRLKRDDDLCGPGEFAPRIFFVALARRVQLLAATLTDETMPFDWPSYLAAVDALEFQHSLRWQEMHRWSNRQQAGMKFGGLVGELQLRGDLAPLASMLAIGELVHVGKACAFGLGQFELDWGGTGVTAQAHVAESSNGNSNV